MSYCGELCFGIVADRDLVDDAWPLADALRHAQEELLALVPKATATPPREHHRAPATRA